MIIECQTCHARFRLDESRITGRGARVKCRKCGDNIVVLKDGAPAPAPPAPGGDGFFDLGSAVRDSDGESPGSPPPLGNLIPFPAPSRPAGAAAPEYPSPAPEAAAPGKDEVDLAFDRFLSAGAEASSPSTGETEAEIPIPAKASAPVEREAPAAPGPRPELDLGTLTLDLGPEEKLDLPPAAEPEPPFGEAPAAEFRGEGGFLISDSDTLDFLQEKHRDAGSEDPPGIGDISPEISSAPVEVPPHREAEPAPAPPVESPALRGSPAPESPRPRSSAGPAVAAVLAVLLAAGGYLGFTTSGRKTLEGAVPGVAALWGGKPAAPAAPKYDLRNVIGYYESGAASPRILVIKGQVANLSTVEKSGIRVHAALLDNTDAVLGQQAVYAGNVLSGEAIRKGDRDTLSKALGNRFGEGLANMHVAPGRAIPFMVVFFDAPANMDSYKLEAKDGE
ncbi:MAG: zinc-ribbon domain-containing protein [Candidatus Deferrimicrobiota bacterium]|mgnify:CR=1 FL=1